MVYLNITHPELTQRTVGLCVSTEQLRIRSCRPQQWELLTSCSIQQIPPLRLLLHHLNSWVPKGVPIGGLTSEQS